MPVLLCSGFGELALREGAESDALLATLSKPYSAAELTARIYRLIEPASRDR